MPLSRGCSNKVKSKNISELVHSGRTLNQAIAASLTFSTRQGCKKKSKKKN